MAPRAVLVERPTEYAALLARHGTREQARFFLRARGRDIAEVYARHEAFAEHRRAVLGSVPADWRRAVAPRSELAAFLFEPEDVVVVLGQDGLVANVSRYLSGQPVIGLDPDAVRNAGVLVRHPPAAAGDLLRDVARGHAALQRRTMVGAALDDGQELLALNEIFVGHRSHQSARYVLAGERQSSSGVIVATGTGATGWAASIVRERRDAPALPAPEERRLAWFVREAWPGWAGSEHGTARSAGTLEEGSALELTCEMGEGGVAFGDGMEADHLALDWGQTVRVGVAGTALALVV